MHTSSGVETDFMQSLSAFLLFFLVEKKNSF